MNYFLLVVLPNLSGLFSSVGFIILIACIICSIVLSFIYSDSSYYSQNYEEEKKQFAIWFRSLIKAFILSLSLLFAACFMPTKKDVIQLKAISIVSELKGVDKIPQKVIDRLNDLLGDSDD